MGKEAFSCPPTKLPPYNLAEIFKRLSGLSPIAYGIVRFSHPWGVHTPENKVRIT